MTEKWKSEDSVTCSPSMTALHFFKWPLSTVIHAQIHIQHAAQESRIEFQLKAG